MQVVKILFDDRDWKMFMGENKKIQGEDTFLSHRHSKYNYCDPGWYYVTICTNRHVWQFGDIINEQVALNETGSIVQAIWESLPQRFPGITLDEYIIMPNHIHGIVLLPEKYPVDVSMSKKDWRRPSIGNIIRTFKGAATYRIRHTTPKTTFQWQPNYYDHIVRNDTDIDRIRLYIANNPAQWLEDQYYRKR